MSVHITYPFDLEEPLIAELREWAGNEIPVREDEAMDGFDGSLALSVVQFVVTSVLSGAAYDVAKNIYLKLKARRKKGKASSGFVLQFEPVGVAYLFEGGNYYRITKAGKQAVSEEEWLTGITERVE